MSTMLRRALCGILMLAAASTSVAQEKTLSYDVVVYGGTAGGTVAAIAVAREGLRVALVEPGAHIGGMVSGGLGATDFANQTVIGGMSREFFERVGKSYGQPISWYFEPHVAEATFRAWLDENKVEVFFQRRVDQVIKEGTQIKSVRMNTGEVFKAYVFIDASYEGDLLPRAGVSYTWGREAQSEYGESLAGRIEYSPKHQFMIAVPPVSEDGKLIPLVYDGDPGRPGDGDKKVQAYNFRLCLTNRPDNMVPFPKPEGYDPARFELLKRYLDLTPTLKMKDLMTLSAMPNAKTDTNNNGPLSTDYIGGSWEYPEADYARRAQIWEDHKRYVQGFLFFLANEPTVPPALQAEVRQWGLAKDEFVDNGNWPHQMYIREARRMKGETVMRQQDLQTERTKPDSIGMGSYNSDSHHVQRIPAPQFPGAPPEIIGVLNEGDMQVPVEPYEIAYRALCPKHEECGNLLVTACVSATHVAYSSMRMEPQYMIMGHSAGVAAAAAVLGDCPVQAIDVLALQAKLREQGQVLSLADAKKP